LDEQIFTSLASRMPPAKLDSMYASYFSDAARRMSRMEAAITAQSQEMFQEAAHSLKGSSGMLGIQWVAAMASVMESVDPMALPDRARSLMNSLYAEIENARRVLAPRLEAVSSVIVPPSVVPSSPIGSKTS
jgi:HPt (histidine-containing phosphotransfer) domain-containing protein